jgi:S1-C subfamily serine protease
MIKGLLFLILLCTPPANAHLNIDLSPEYDDSYAAEMDPYAPRGLKVAYSSSVIVQVFEEGVPLGTGSGNYFRLGKHRFIITASHVIEGEGEILIMEKGFVMTEATVVYADPYSDIAILIPKEKLKYTKAIPFRRDITNQIGEKVYHCGHPARESFHISEGLLTGTNNDTLLVNTFAWPGSSGSVLFDENGRVIGTLSAIRIDGPFGIPSMVEHIVLASNIKMLDQNTLKKILRDARD